MKKVYVFFIGLFSILLFFEAGLRLTAYFGSSRFEDNELDKSPKIMCVGDSYVYGTGVRRGEDYPSILDRLITSHQVLNFGEPGANTARVIEIIRENIDNIRPEILIVQVGANNNWNKKGLNDREASDLNISQKENDIIYDIKVLKFFKLLKEHILKTFLKSKKKYKKIQPSSNVRFKSDILSKLYCKKEVPRAQNDFLNLVEDRVEKKWVNKYIELIKGNDVKFSEEIAKKDMYEAILLIEKYIRQNKFKKALTLSLMHTDDPIFYIYNGFIYYSLNEDELAEKWLSKLYDIKKDMFSEYSLAMFYFLNGEEKKFQDILKKSTSHNSLLYSTKLLFLAEKEKKFDKKEIYEKIWKCSDSYYNFSKLNLMNTIFKDNDINKDFLKEFFYLCTLDNSFSEKFLFNTVGNPWIYSNNYQDIIKDVDERVFDNSIKIFKRFPDYRIELKYYLYKSLMIRQNISIGKTLEKFKEAFSIYPGYLGLYRLFSKRYFSDFRPFINDHYLVLNQITSNYNRDRNIQQILDMISSDIKTKRALRSSKDLENTLDILKKNIRKYPDVEIFYDLYSDLAVFMYNRGKIKDFNEMISIIERQLELFYDSTTESKLGYLYRWRYFETLNEDHLEISLRYFLSVYNKTDDEVALNNYLNTLIWTNDVERVKNFFKDHNISINIDTYIRLTEESVAEEFLKSQKKEQTLNENIVNKSIREDNNIIKDIYKINDICRKKNIRLLLINYPFKDMLEYRMMIKESKLEILDVFNLFKDQFKSGEIQEQDIFLKDQHLTGKGNKYTAEYVCRRLLNNGWIDKRNIFDE